MVVDPIIGWESEGHQIVASLAEKMLSVPAASFVSAHLYGASMASVSSWADSVAWSDDLHFAHTPYPGCDAFVFERDCGFNGSGRCIVSAIADFTIQASDVNASAAERSEALKFLIHLYADIHQPLHMGFARDHGGLDIILGIPSETSLHSFWDSNLISIAAKTIGRAAGLEGYLWSKYSVAMLDKDRRAIAGDGILRLSEIYSQRADIIAIIGEIATETAITVTCTKAYQHHPDAFIQSGDSISKEYKSSRSKIAANQLLKAAIRLANAIEEIASVYAHAKSMIVKVVNVEPPKENAPDKAPPSPPNNRFEVLEQVMDFDLDDIVEERADSPVDSFSSPQEAEENVMTPGSGRARSSSTQFQEHSPVTSSEVALIKVHSVYVLTHRSLAHKHGYKPFQFHSFWVRYLERSTGLPKRVLINFDANVFPRYEPLLLRALFALRRKAIANDSDNAAAESPNDIKLIEGMIAPPVDMENRPVNEEALAEGYDEVYLRSFLSLHDIDPDEWSDPSGSKDEILASFKKKSRAAVSFVHDNLLMISLINVLRSPPHPMMRYNKYKILDPNTGVLRVLLIDKNLLNADIDERVLEVVLEIVERTQILLARTRQTIPDWLQEEIVYIEWYYMNLTERDAEAVSTRLSKFVCWPDTPAMNYFHMEWQFRADDDDRIETPALQLEFDLKNDQHPQSPFVYKIRRSLHFITLKSRLSTDSEYIPITSQRLKVTYPSGGTAVKQVINFDTEVVGEEPDVARLQAVLRMMDPNGPLYDYIDWKLGTP